MIFSLEALNAKYGDCFILHFGSAHKRRFAVIDGGPKGVFAESLQPRLLELRQETGVAESEIFYTDLLMISHIDDDHIHGINDWLADLAVSPLGWGIRDCWFNAFPDLVSKLPAPMQAAAATYHEPQPDDPNSRETRGARAVIASVAQGRDLRGYLDSAGIRVNGKYSLLFAGKQKITYQKDSLTLHLVAPNEKALERLHQKWESTPVKTASLDNAVENLSSLVVLAESGGRRVLLTGDARGDYILEGLEDAGYFHDDICNVDVLKLPHHGSCRNCTQSLFERVCADHYIISANGRYENPDTETLLRLAKARGDKPDYNIYLTNGPKSSPVTPEEISLANNIKAALRECPWLESKLVYRSKNNPIRIDLLDKL
jgi:hypothetical protein